MKTLLIGGCLLAASVVSTAQTGNVGIGITTPQSQLHTTGSVRHDTMAGAGSRPVYADAQGRMFTQPPIPPNTVYPATAIADLSCSNGSPVNTPITITGQSASVPSANIKVRVNISHTYDDDLQVYLLSPAGNTLRLISDNGGSGDNFTNTIFWDGATQSLPVSSTAGVPFTGTYKPTGGLAVKCAITPDVSTFGAMGGGSIVPNGTWRLLVFDDQSGDLGTLNNWGITFDGTDPQVPASPLFPVNVVPKGGPVSFTASNIFDVNGNVGIGTATPAAPLQFSNTFVNRKIVLYDNFNNDHQYYGFGISVSDLRYQTDGVFSDHVFWAATGSTASNQLMRIKGNGRVGIGTAAPSPGYTLDVASADNIVANFSSSSTDPNGVVNINVPTVNSACNGCTELIRFTKAGTTLLGAIGADLLGNGVLYTSASDKRLKEAIAPTRFGISDLMRLEVKDYNFIGTDRRVTGLLAQDLYTIYPDAVKAGDLGEAVETPWGVDYGKLTPLLVKAVQDQQAEIEELKKQNAALTTVNTDLQKGMAELSGQMQQVLKALAPGTAGK